MNESNRIMPIHQYISNDKFETGTFKDIGAVVNVTVVYVPASEGFGQFYYDVEYHGFDHEFPSQRNPDMNFGIPGDCTVNIKLQDPQNWRWSKQYYALTAKKSLTKIYKDYSFDEKTQTVTFKAKMDKMPPKKYYFIMNVDILQKESSAEYKWLSVSIDPWVLNPQLPQ